MEKTTSVVIDEIGPPRETASLTMASKLDKEKKSAGVTMQNIVHSMYEKYRIGNRRPSEPFLRVSARVDCENRPLWRDWEPGAQLGASHAHLNKVLVYGEALKSRVLPQRSEQKLCLYPRRANREYSTLQYHR
jgi:hypothetical protein